MAKQRACKWRTDETGNNDEENGEPGGSPERAQPARGPVLRLPVDDGAERTASAVRIAGPSELRP